MAHHRNNVNLMANIKEYTTGLKDNPFKNTWQEMLRTDIL